jgi:hypothetical protein
VAGYLVVFVALPLGEVVRRSLLGRDGSFVGLDNFIQYFATPSLANSMVNSPYISTLNPPRPEGRGFSPPHPNLVSSKTGNLHIGTEAPPRCESRFRDARV